MTNESANNPIDQNTTCSTAALSQFASSTEAFTTITRDDFKKNPLAGQMMARLYAEKTNELNEANEKILELTKQVSFYRSFPIANIGFALMNVIGTIVVGLGVSLDINLWLIILGSILVLSGNLLPLLYTKKECRMGDEIKINNDNQYIIQFCKEENKRNII